FPALAPAPGQESLRLAIQSALHHAAARRSVAGSAATGRRTSRRPERTGARLHQAELGECRGRSTAALSSPDPAEKELLRLGRGSGRRPARRRLLRLFATEKRFAVRTAD